jgi:hypothetical protein
MTVPPQLEELRALKPHLNQITHANQYAYSHPHHRRFQSKFPLQPAAYRPPLPVARMMSSRFIRPALAATARQTPRCATRSYAAAASIDPKPPVPLFGVDGTYASALVCLYCARREEIGMRCVNSYTVPTSEIISTYPILCMTNPYQLDCDD